MSEIKNAKTRRFHAAARTALATALLLAAPTVTANAGGSEDRICFKTADHMLASCRFEASEDLNVEQGKCLNGSPGDLRSCDAAAQAERREKAAECKEVRDHRKQICSDLGEGRYDPVIDPANFVAVIDNPYAPFKVGSIWRYEGMTPEGLEEILFEILPDKRDFGGIEATTIRDTVWVGGVVVEDTLDWVAQDVNGDVWYFGEISQSFEDGRLVDTHGSWETGRDGAKPGLWITGNPVVGQFYRQEFLLGDAEDMVEVLSVDAQGHVFPFANGQPVLQTRDYLGVEVGGDEWKFYVPGVGFVLEVDPETGARLELIDYQP